MSNILKTIRATTLAIASATAFKASKVGKALKVAPAPARGIVDDALPPSDQDALDKNKTIQIQAGGKHLLESQLDIEKGSFMEGSVLDDIPKDDVLAPVRYCKIKREAKIANE